MSENSSTRVEIRFLKEGNRKSINDFLDLLNNNSEPKSTVLRRYLQKGYDRLVLVCQSRGISLEDGMLQLVLEADDFGREVPFFNEAQPSADGASLKEATVSSSKEEPIDKPHKEAKAIVTKVEEKPEPILELQNDDFLEEPTEPVLVGEEILVQEEVQSVEIERSSKDDGEHDWGDFAALAGANPSDNN